MAAVYHLGRSLELSVELFPGHAALIDSTLDGVEKHRVSPRVVLSVAHPPGHFYDPDEVFVIALSMMGAVTAKKKPEYPRKISLIDRRILLLAQLREGLLAGG